MAKLFSEDFIRSVSQLRIVARQVPAGGRHAEQRSRDLGSGMEFRDFRSYVPGDDLRRVDWNMYRRSGRLFLRLFEETEDLPLYILLDLSDSMYFDAPPRADAARQLAGALAAISLNQLDRVGVYPFGEDLARPLVPTMGTRGLRLVLEYLEGLGPAGPTNLPRSLQRFAMLPVRSGLAAVISDFFDPQGIQATIEALGLLRHRLLLVQVVRPTDADPELAGELTLVDCETQAAVAVSISPTVRQAYRSAYEGFCDRLLRFAALRRAAHLRLHAGLPVLQQLSTLFRAQVFET